MAPDFIAVPTSHITDMRNQPPLRFDAARLGLSGGDVMRSGAFDARQMQLDVGTILWIEATDGRFWAQIVGKTPDGRLVLEAAQVPYYRSAGRRAA